MCGRGDSRPEASTEPTLVFTSPPSRGRDGSGEGHWGVYFGEVGDDCAAPAALLVSSVAADACSTTALHHQHPIHPASVCSVPCLSRDQGLTNDVYAVVLVDICWQNRSPVRHLEWN